MVLVRVISQGDLFDRPLVASTAVIKPNWVLDSHLRDPQNPALLAPMLTDPALVARVAKSVTADRISIAEAPQFDADWQRLSDRLDLPGMLSEVKTGSTKSQVELVDLRQQIAQTTASGLVVNRTLNPAATCTVVNLGAHSALCTSRFAPQRLRGSDYEYHETVRHHSNGRHEYCIAQKVLDADLIVNVPKLKTHKKAGVTLCLKNLVGINGNKNYLPHHHAGAPSRGGDEYPDEPGHLYRTVRAWAVDRARVLMKYRALLPLARLARSTDLKTRPKDLIRNGNWYGNDTVWRMVLDLNRILLYADHAGRIQNTAQRRVVHVIDALVGGEGDGPLAPDRHDVGLIIISDDAVAADFVATALMGFDPFKIPTIRHALEPHPLPITALGPQAQGLEIEFEGKRLTSWRELPNHHFKPHPGWAGHIERE